MYDWDYITINVIEPGAPLTVSADGPGLGDGYETLVGEPVQLSGYAYGGDGVYYWSWDFGDGSAGSNIQNPTHVYDAPGTYTVTLTVTSSGETASDTAEVVVYDVEELLVNVGHDLDTIVGIDNLFSVSVKGGRAPYSYLWDFGDGATSTVASPVHVFTNLGEYVVEVTVTDSLGKSKSDKSMVSVVEDTTIEQCEILSVSGGLGIKASISSGDEPVDWSIDVDGGIVLLGGHNSGNIPEKSEQTIQIPLTFGFGKVEITVTANNLIEKRTAYLVGPFFLGVREI
jgi:immune inhibitor A